MAKKSGVDASKVRGKDKEREFQAGGHFHPMLQATT
jgi:hypothetical protein